MSTRKANQPTVCPYCGATGETLGRGSDCASCGGLFEPLSKQATQNGMGPWFVRDERNPFRPGCSLAVLKGMIARGAVTPETIIRGPGTRQFWMRAISTPGIANLFSRCHACGREVMPKHDRCGDCGASFEANADRENLGLMPVRLLPGQATVDKIADGALKGAGYDMSNVDTTGAVKLEPEPEPEAPKRPATTLTAEQRTARLAAIEAEARAVLRERRERAGKRNVVVGIALGLLLLCVTAVVLVAISNFGGPAAAPAAAGNAGLPAAGGPK